MVHKVTEWLNKMSIITLSLELHKMCLYGFAMKTEKRLMTFVFCLGLHVVCRSSDTFIAK